MKFEFEISDDEIGEPRMTRSQATPASSQIICLETRLRRMEDANHVLHEALTKMGIGFISDEERIKTVIAALEKSHALQSGAGTRP